MFQKLLEEDLHDNQPVSTDHSQDRTVNTDQPSQYMIDLPSRFDRWEPLVEIIATIVLALATLSTAWSGYQAARWGGEQADKYSQASARRLESTRASTRAGQQMQVDIGLFTNWINAYANNNQDLANFYEERFRPEFIPAFEAWLETKPAQNPDAPPSPFSMTEYRLSEQEKADLLSIEADQLSGDAVVANDVSDQYILNTVFLASVLFLVGITSQVKSSILKTAVVILAIAIMAYCFYSIIILPIS